MIIYLLFQVKSDVMIKNPSLNPNNFGDDALLNKISGTYDSYDLNEHTRV